jgi:hypothetical protein
VLAAVMPAAVWLALGPRVLSARLEGAAQAARGCKWSSDSRTVHQ